MTETDYEVACTKCGKKHIPDPGYLGNKSKCPACRGPYQGKTIGCGDWFLFGPNNARDSDWDD